MEILPSQSLPRIEVKFSLSGKTKRITVPTTISSSSLYVACREAFLDELADSARTKIKLILKGKVLDDAATTSVFPPDLTTKSKLELRPRTFIGVPTLLRIDTTNLLDWSHAAGSPLGTDRTQILPMITRLFDFSRSCQLIRV